MVFEQVAELDIYKEGSYQELREDVISNRETSWKSSHISTRRAAIQRAGNVCPSQ